MGVDMVEFVIRLSFFVFVFGIEICLASDGATG